MQCQGLKVHSAKQRQCIVWYAIDIQETYHENGSTTVESGTVRSLPNILDPVRIPSLELLAKVLECTLDSFSMALKCRLTPSYKAVESDDPHE